MKNVKVLWLFALFLLLLSGCRGKGKDDAALQAQQQKKSDAYFDGILAERQAEEEKINEINQKLKGIVCYGGLYTLGTNTTDYVTCLKKKVDKENDFDIPMYNYGIIYEDSASVLARMGALPLLCDSFTIAESVDTLTHIDVYTMVGDKKRSVNILCGKENPGINPVNIKGVEGTLYGKTDVNDRKKTSDFYFNRDENGKSDVVATGSAIETVAAREKADYITVLWIGDEGGYDNLEELEKQYLAFKDYAKDKKYIVIGRVSHEDEYPVYKDFMEKTFGDKYLDIKNIINRDSFDSHGDLKGSANELLAENISVRMKELGYFEY